jgi:hypothetical protein
MVPGNIMPIGELIPLLIAGAAYFILLFASNARKPKAQ